MRRGDWNTLHVDRSSCSIAEHDKNWNSSVVDYKQVFTVLIWDCDMLFDAQYFDVWLRGTCNPNVTSHRFLDQVFALLTWQFLCLFLYDENVVVMLLNDHRRSWHHGIHGFQMTKSLWHIQLVVMVTNSQVRSRQSQNLNLKLTTFRKCSLSRQSARQRKYDCHIIMLILNTF